MSYHAETPDTIDQTLLKIWMNQRVKLIFIVIIAIFIFTTFIILNWDVGKEKKNLQEKKTMTGDQMTIAKELRIQKFNNCDLLSEVKIEKVEVNREKIGFLRFKFKKILTLQKVNIILNEYIEEGDKKDSEYLPIVESMDFLKTPQEYDIYGLTINELEILLRRKSGEEITITADQGELRYNGNYLRIIGNISISPAPKYIKKVEEILFPLKDIDNNKIVIKYIPALSQKHAKNEGLQKIKVMEDKIFLYEIITSKTKSEVKL